MQSDHRLTQAYIHAHPVEAARRIETLPAEQAAALLMPLATPEISAVTEHLLPAPGAALLEHLPRDVAAEVITTLSSSSTITILRHCDQELRVDLLNRLGNTVGASLRRALTYPNGTAGSLADPRVLTLPPDITVGEALARIAGDQRNTTYYLYVLERDNTLTGVVTMKQLVVGKSHQLVGTIMNRRVVTLSAGTSTEELLKHPHWRQFHTMPVLDREGIFLGVLRYRTLRKVEEEAFPSAAPGSLSQALISLWELYALAGIRVMTDVAGALTAPPEETARHTPQDK